MQNSRLPALQQTLIQINPNIADFQPSTYDKESESESTQHGHKQLIARRQELCSWTAWKQATSFHEDIKAPQLSPPNVDTSNDFAASNPYSTEWSKPTSAPYFTIGHDQPVAAKQLYSPSSRLDSQAAAPLNRTLDDFCRTSPPAEPACRPGLLLDPDLAGAPACTRRQPSPLDPVAMLAALACPGGMCAEPFPGGIGEADPFHADWPFW